MACSGKIPRELLFRAEQGHTSSIPETGGEYLGFQAKFSTTCSILLFAGDFSFFSAKLLRAKSMRDTINDRKDLPIINDELV
jgi:hypothetical protein